MYGNYLLQFRNIFTQFLFSPKGAIYQANFWFADKLECGLPTPDILLQVGTRPTLGSFFSSWNARGTPTPEIILQVCTTTSAWFDDKLECGKPIPEIPLQE
jgi:hypothetical protein